MLIIVHHRNVQLLLQFLFNVKTFRCFNIFQVDAAESGFQCFYDLHKFFRIFFIDLNIKHINVGKNFKQHALSFHHRFAGFGTNIAQAQYGRAIADNALPGFLWQYIYKHLPLLQQFLCRVRPRRVNKQGRDRVAFLLLWWELLQSFPVFLSNDIQVPVVFEFFLHNLFYWHVSCNRYGFQAVMLCTSYKSMSCNSSLGSAISYKLSAIRQYNYKTFQNMNISCTMQTYLAICNFNFYYEYCLWWLPNQAIIPIPISIAFSSILKVGVCTPAVIPFSSFITPSR